jgi:HTH-type transcriptional regulator, transcriptional repressor of NAD biosynthesis genes
MKRGLVIGKFMPIHKGHIALLNFAASQCDELIVSMSFTNNDVIDCDLRFWWIKEIFKDQEKIHLCKIKDDFDDDTLPLELRTKHWAQRIQEVYPPIDLIFSSEQYGESFARNLGVGHFIFDIGRKDFPVSASLIRKKPFAYWDFIPPIVQPYFVKKICFYGSESTGKSTMAKKMAEHYQTEFVPEVAREIISSNDFSVNDIIKIGYAQMQRTVDKTKTANKFLFCDTDLITTEIYSQIYLNEVPSVLYELEKQIQYDVYFLFDIDVKWVEDGLRDMGDKREIMFAKFKQELDKRNIDYILVSGKYEQREQFVVEKLNKLIKKFS